MQRIFNGKNSPLLAYMIFLLILAGCGLDKSNNPLLTENNMVKVDGKPTFILGLYENPKDDARLKEAVDAGFNLIMCQGNQTALDRVDKAGAKAWVNLGRMLDLGKNKEKNRDRLLKTVTKLKDHRALLIWEGLDEYLWQQWWGPYSYILTNEIPKMKEVARQHPELLPLLNQLIDLQQRALWSKFDAKRIEFWQRSGQDMPKPQFRLADMLTQAKLTGDGITKGIKFVKETDPKHIVWLNHAPRNSVEDLTSHNQAADMVGCDIYPITVNAGHSDLANISISSVGAYTEKIRRLDDNKACAMVLQGMGFWDIPPFRNEGHTEEHGRRPTSRETRFMAYDAIVHGANAIMYWGTSYVKDKENGNETMDTQFWQELLRTARQIRAIDQALVAPTITPGPTIKLANRFSSATEKDLPIMLKKAGEDYVLIAVNESASGMAFTISKLPAELEGRTMHRLGSQESIVIKDRKLHDGISAFDVGVYATSRRFEPPGF